MNDRIHYIEYLGQLIMKNSIDPINIFEDYELELVLKRNNISLPFKCSKEPSEYSKELIELIQQSCPLEGTD